MAVIITNPVFDWVPDLSVLSSALTHMVMNISRLVLSSVLEIFFKTKHSGMGIGKSAWGVLSLNGRGPGAA